MGWSGNHWRGGGGGRSSRRGCLLLCSFYIFIYFGLMNIQYRRYANREGYQGQQSSDDLDKFMMIICRSAFLRAVLRNFCRSERLTGAPSRSTACTALRTRRLMKDGAGKLVAQFRFTYTYRFSVLEKAQLTSMSPSFSARKTESLAALSFEDEPVSGAIDEILLLLIHSDSAAARSRCSVSLRTFSISASWYGTSTAPVRTVSTVTVRIVQAKANRGTFKNQLAS